MYQVTMYLTDGREITKRCRTVYDVSRVISESLRQANIVRTATRILH